MTTGNAVGCTLGFLWFTAAVIFLTWSMVDPSKNYSQAVYRHELVCKLFLPWFAIGIAGLFILLGFGIIQP